MDVRVKVENPVPGVEYGENPQLPADVLGIKAERQERFGGGAHEDGVQSDNSPSSRNRSIYLR